ncbi:hypothetical protein [Lentzea sp.]|uniref:hypothetical protein n=1 Tax=Lentzea sp. TaxID=56099 RepID=UPI002ED1C2FB
MPEKYATSAKSALMALMLANREMPNTELKSTYKITLLPKDRDALNRDKLLETLKEGRRLIHKITDRGIDWCMTHLVESDLPGRVGPQARVNQELLRRVVPFLRERGLLAEAIRSRGLEDLIRQVYLDLGDGYQDWVRLAKVRPRLNGADRNDVDETLLKMVKEGSAHLVPDSNRKVLTEEDHAAAIRVGGEDKHLMAIEES